MGSLIIGGLFLAFILVLLLIDQFDRGTFIGHLALVLLVASVVVIGILGCFIYP